MKRLQLLAASLTLFAAACASNQSNTAPPTSTSTLETHHAVNLPNTAGEGAAKQVTIQLDEGPLKLATIALRDGTELPPHTAPVPVTIHVLEGTGVIHVGTEALDVVRGSVVLLPAHADHDVIPAPGTDMLLLVHYMRGAAHSAQK